MHGGRRRVQRLAPDLFEREHSPYTPQYNGVAERVLKDLCDKTIALLWDVSEGKSNRL